MSTFEETVWLFRAGRGASPLYLSCRRHVEALLVALGEVIEGLKESSLTVGNALRKIGVAVTHFPAELLELLFELLEFLFEFLFEISDIAFRSRGVSIIQELLLHVVYDLCDLRAI